jgi:hypothetical protein
MRRKMKYLGYVDEINRFYVTGWVANESDWQQTLSVDILVNDLGQGCCSANIFREQLDQLHPDATGRYVFKFYFSDPLDMYSQQEVKVRVSGSSYYLIQRDGPIKPVESDPDVGMSRPSGPIIVSTMGRTGSTAVMAVLAQHPNIVVAGAKPYEVEMGCYYAYALRTLVAAGDHTSSLRTDKITATENRFHIGFNPYFEHGFSSVFTDPQSLQKFRTERLPRRLGRAFRNVILDYYEEVAKDQGIDNPIYFAEKSLPERDSRLGIRFMFPGMREIALVRDPRDVVCSATSSNGRSFDQMLEDTVAAAQQMQSILNERRPSVMLMRYEDFMLEHDKTLAAMFRFLGLTLFTLDQQSMRELFGNHATSVSPAASIGRWKTDLTLEQQKKCDVFAPLLDQFGYSVT